MTNTLPTVVPAELQELQNRFTRWRRTRRPGTPIPPALWAAVIGVAHRYGATRTARVLGLDSHKVKTLMDASDRPQPAAARPTFVELVAPPAGGRACLLEVEGPRGGRLRLQLTSQELPDLVALARIMWSPDE